MADSKKIVIEDPSQVAEARRLARKMADALEFDEVRAEQVAIVVTEASTNILKHAGRGEVLLRSSNGFPDGHTELEVLALDQGPGMSNLEQCLRDGYSTGGSPGQGLGAIRRLADESDFYSVREKGTAVMARWRSGAGPAGSNGTPGAAGRLHVGAVNVAKQGQDVCGDAWGIQQTDESSVLLVADGLGHGYEASLASNEAVRTLRGHSSQAPHVLIDLTHKALRSSRGAAVAVARIDRVRRKLTFCGVGNVAAQIYSGSESDAHLVSVNGTAGHDTPRIREFSYDWPENGMLIMYSDGLASTTGLEAQPRLALHDPSLIAGVLYRDFNRGQDDATVVVAKAG